MSALYRCHYALEADERRAESEGAASDPAAAADLPHIPPLTMEEATRARCVAFLHYLCTLQSRTRCSHLAVALDARGKNFRHELFNAYKSHRPPVPREVAASAQLLREALPEVGVPFLQVHGVEADDIIGTIAVHACQRGMDVLISSADRDYYQLLRPGLSLLRSTKGSLVPEQAYTHEDFEREWALRPAQYLDFLALQGDRSDNIPGMPGVGVKTALTLLRRHGCLDAFLEAAIEAGAGESRKTGLAQEAGSGASESIAPAEGRVPRRNLAPPSAPSPPLSAWEARATRAAADPQTAHTVRLSRRLATILTSLDIPATRGGLGELAVRRPADGGAAARRTLRALGAGHLVERWQLAWRE